MTAPWVWRQLLEATPWRLLQAHASTTFAALCPAFDPEAMRAAATAALDPERQACAQIDRLLSDLELDL